MPAYRKPANSTQQNLGHQLAETYFFAVIVEYAFLWFSWLKQPKGLSGRGTEGSNKCQKKMIRVHC